MGIILWIDQNTFASNLIERVFKKKDIPFYTLTAPVDFTYIAEDLKPSVIVLDGPTALQHLDEFFKQYNASKVLQDIPYIIIDDSPELHFLKKIGEIKKPIDPFKVPAQIENLLGKLS